MAERPEKRSNKIDRSTNEEGPRVHQLPRVWKYVLLLPISLHLLAVFAEPFHFFTRSEVQTAPDANALRKYLHPYAQWMFLDHGYFFFAPNPGPGHLLRVSASEDPIPVSNSVSRQPPNPQLDTEIFPDRNQQWPRLLYHRYFMFSEFYYSRYAPVELTKELAADPTFQARWSQDRRVYTSLQQSIIGRTKHRMGKTFVNLERLERALPDRESILRKDIRLTDSRWLTVLPETMEPMMNAEAILETSPPLNKDSSVPAGETVTPAIPISPNR